MRGERTAWRVVGIGAGGHARSLLDAIRLQWGSRVELLGLTDNAPARQAQTCLGVPVLGPDERLPELCRAGASHFFLGVGGTGDNQPRRRLFEWACGLGLEPLAIQHPAAVVAASARLGRGVAVLAGAVVGPGAQVGDNVIVNTAAVVEHDCVIGAHVHLASGCVLGGGVVVEEAAHVGLGASLRQQVRIGAGAVAGAGAVVVADVAPGSVVVGNPARPWQRNSG